MAANLNKVIFQVLYQQNLKNQINIGTFFQISYITEAILVWCLTKLSFRRQVIDKLRTFIRCVILKLLLDLGGTQTYPEMIQEKK